MITLGVAQGSLTQCQASGRIRCPAAELISREADSDLFLHSFLYLTSDEDDGMELH